MKKFEKEKILHTPLTKNMLLNLIAGTEILLYGEIITARDQACKRIIKSTDKKFWRKILKNKLIYHTGSTPDINGRLGVAGPTTSGRIDIFVEELLTLGCSGFMGKGVRSEKVISILKKYNAIYLAVPSVAALLSKNIIGKELIAFPELGAEGVYILKIKKFPAIVINDIYGNDLYRKRIILQE